MRRTILFIILVMGMCVFGPGGAYSNEISQATTLVSDITCITTAKPTNYYVVSTFPTDTILTGLFKAVYPGLSAYTLNVMGKMQNTSTSVYTWHMYFSDSTSTLQHCWVELAMTKNSSSTKYPYYWIYTLYIPTTTTTVSCSGILEKKY